VGYLKLNCTKLLFFCALLGGAHAAYAIDAANYALSADDLSTPTAQYLLDETPQGQQALSALFQKLHAVRMATKKNKEDALNDLLKSNDPFAKKMRLRVYWILKTIFIHRQKFFEITDQNEPVSLLDATLLKRLARNKLNIESGPDGEFDLKKSKKLMNLRTHFKSDQEVRDALRASSVQFTETRAAQGATVFNIKPDGSAGASELNRMASAAERLGIQVRFQRFANKNIIAMFSPSQNAVYVTNESIIDGAPDENVAHEFMHAIFHKSEAAGVPNVFDVWLERVFSEDLSTYEPQVAYGLTPFPLQELATHAYQAKLYATHLARLMEAGGLQGTNSEEVVTHLKSLSLTGASIGAYAHEVFIRASTAIAHGQAVRYTVQQNKNGGTMGLSADLRFTDPLGASFATTVPMDRNDAIFFQKIAEQDVFKHKLKSELRKQLDLKLMARMKQIDEIGLDLYPQFSKLSEHANLFSQDMSLEDRKQWVSELVRLADAPMHTVAPYIGFDPGSVNDCLLPELRTLLLDSHR
jgi:hypothetical protein